MTNTNEWLTGADVASIAGLKYKTLWTYRKRGTLPQPDQYIGNKPLWNRSTIEQWNSERITRVTDPKQIQEHP